MNRKFPKKFADIFDSIFRNLRFDKDGFIPFESVFDRLEKEFNSNDRDDLFDFGNPSVIGFSMTITPDPETGKPRMQVKRFGGDKLQGKWDYKPDMVENRDKTSYESHIVASKDVIFSNPEVSTYKNREKFVIEVKLPYIDHMDQIEINYLENSVEIKAVNNLLKKGYFCIVEKDPLFTEDNARVSFDKNRETLIIEWDR